MPGFVIHLSAAKVWLDKHKGSVKEPDQFLRGVIEPDLLRKPFSHYGEDTTAPGLDRYIACNDMESDFCRGYFFHLLTDHLFYNEYLNNFVWKPEVYDDYDRLNKLLMEEYGIDLPDSVRSAVRFKDGSLEVFNYESIKGFIETVGNIDLEQYIKQRTPGSPQEP